MADEKSHISWGFLLGMFYAGLGAVSYNFGSETALLAFILVLIGSVIPNIDSTDDGITGEFAGLFGALMPLILLQRFPELSGGGTVRIALVLILGFFFARVVFSFLTNNVFANRGALHSVPSAILFSEIGFLNFPDLHWKGRAFLGLALGVGVLSHIIIDAFTNISFVKKTVAKSSHSGSVIKFSGASASSTWFIYLAIIGLGWFVAKDVTPSLKVQAPVTVDPSQTSK